MFWQIFYVSSLVFIKASICAQLVRITTNRYYIIFLWTLVALSAMVSLLGFFAVLLRCKPVAASWDPSLGTCVDQMIIIVITYVVSGMNIFTDWSVAVMPVLILWNVQMRKTLKRMAGIIMGVGAL